MSEDKLNKEGLARVWLKIWSLVKVLVGDVDVKGKGSLQVQVDNLDTRVGECFRNASDGKRLVADAVTGKGVPTSASDTFAAIANKIAMIESPPPGGTYDDGVAYAVKEWAVQSNGTYYFAPDRSYKWTSNNQGVHSSIAETTWTITLSSPVEYTFLYKVSSESGYDELSVILDGSAIVSAISGDGTEQKITKTLSEGTHTLKATHSKDGSVNAGQGTGYLILNPVVKNASINLGSGEAPAGTATASDVLSGKTFSNASSIGLSGSMSNEGGTTVDAGSVTQDDSYTYLTVPLSGYYDTSSKLRAANSDLGKKTLTLMTGRGQYNSGSAIMVYAYAKVYYNGSVICSTNTRWERADYGVGDAYASFKI